LITERTQSSTAGLATEPAHTRSVKAVWALAVIGAAATAVGAYRYSFRNMSHLRGASSETSGMERPDPVAASSSGLAARTMLIASRFLPASALLGLSGLITKLSRLKGNTRPAGKAGPHG
jgi:hypothetical protein